MDNRFELTIGPLLFNWSADAFSDFYAKNRRRGAGRSRRGGRARLLETPALLRRPHSRGHRAPRARRQDGRARLARAPDARARAPGGPRTRGADGARARDRRPDASALDAAGNPLRSGRWSTSTTRTRLPISRGAARGASACRRNCRSRRSASSRKRPRRLARASKSGPTAAYPWRSRAAAITRASMA